MMNDNKDINITNAGTNPEEGMVQQAEATAENVVEAATVEWGPEDVKAPQGEESVVVAQEIIPVDTSASDPVPPYVEPEIAALAAAVAGTKAETESDMAGKEGETEENKEKKKSKIGGVLGNKTIEDVINREAKEEQLSSKNFSVSKALGGVMIARVFQKQIGLVLLVCAFLIIYISNRYVCQKKMVEISNIEARIQKARYKSIVCTSALTEKSRESNIMRLLGQYGDSTLRMSNEPPYLIEVKDE